MENTNKVNVDEVIELIFKDAEKMERNANANGDTAYAETQRMKEQISFYNYGRNQVIPPEWKKYADQLDDEYQEYLRLEKKFGKK